MEYVAALDLGSSKMLALAASKFNRNEIIASDHLPSEQCIRRGLIVNTSETSKKLTELIRRFNAKLNSTNTRLQKIYVGIGGQSLHTREISIQRELNGKAVDYALVDEIENECAGYSDDSFALFHYLPPEFYIDGHPELFPEGIEGEQIEAKCLLILGHPSIKSDIEKLLADARIEIAGIEVAPLATAEAVLTENEKKTGCALVEVGAGLTYFSVYKDDSLRYLATLPLGGNAITQDICSMDNRTPAEAEAFKKSADVQVETKDNPPLQAIEARTLEIVANIKKQMELSDCESSIQSLALTGGGSLLQNFDKLLEQECKKTVRRITDSPEQSCARGLLKMGKENCVKEIALVKPVSEKPKQPDIFGEEKPIETPRPPKPPKERKNIFGALRKTTDKVVKGLFDDNE